MMDEKEEQYTLEGIEQQLKRVAKEDHQKIVQVVLGMLPQVKTFLKTRPYSQEEANELFAVYLQLRYLSKRNDPYNEEESYRKEWVVLQMDVGELIAIDWLEGMCRCLVEVREYLLVNGLVGKDNPLDVEEVELYLKAGDFILEEENGKLFVHLSEDSYNEFGVELKEEYFK